MTVVTDVSPRRLFARRAGELLAALLVASVVGTLTLLVVNAPSFAEPSWLPESFGVVLTVGVVVSAGWLLLRRTTGDRGLWLLGTAGPDKMIGDLDAGLTDAHGDVKLHFYTFGGMKATAEWIQKYQAKH